MIVRQIFEPRKIVTFLSVFITSIAWSQTLPYETLFEPLLNPFPEKATVEYLASMPKFKTIHHDNFSRRIGKTSEVYSVLSSKKSKIKSYIGLDNVNVFYGQGKGRKSQTTINYIDTERKDYGFMISRLLTAAVAFRVVDVDNYYYVKVDKSSINLYLVENGTESLMSSIESSGGDNFYFLIQGSKLYMYDNYRYCGICTIDKFSDSTICGILFSNKFYSAVKEFIVDYPASFTDNKVDSFIESNTISSKKFAYHQTEEGMITTSTKHVASGSKRSLRVELDYYSDWENHKVASSRRSEILPVATNATPLDSWICCFDIYFPGKSDGNEYYASDELSELFWQSHDNGAADGLNPNLALYLKNDVITLQTRSRGLLLDNKSNVFSNTDIKLDGTIAKLVDKTTSNPSVRELKKGQWHRFLIYIKEGYSASQLPKTVVYVDGKKVIDWSIPNAYNCESKAEYLKMGLYKWSWASSSIKSDVKKRVVYYDNISYLR